VIVNVENLFGNKPFDGIDAIPNEKDEDNQFSMYPNPSTNNKLIIIPHLTKNIYTQSTIKIYDLNGNIILQKQCNEQMVTFDLNTLKKGIYMVEMLSTDYQSIQKLLVE